MIEKANAAGSLGISNGDMGYFNGNGVNQPATDINWHEAATYVNWLNTSTGNTAAYKFVGGTFTLWSPTDAGYNAKNMFRNSNAKFWLPSTDEWYKAAYGNPNGSWSNFPNGSDSVPTVLYTWGPPDITSAGELSAYGTMGQGGGVWEWNETAYDGTNDTAGENRVLRGASWQDNGIYRDASYLRSENPSNGLGNLGGYTFGFRVAMIPEPSSLSLLALGGVVVALRRRR
jgi:formylglycine-generating enzyme required for sulfatase activity